MDFEKFWGVHDVLPLNEAAHIKKVSVVVPALLNLFERYDIHCSWATVGLLGRTELKKDVAAVPYTNQNFSPFPLTQEKYGDFDPDLLSGKKEIKAIQNSPYQELASHTYSHFYCSENGINTNDFESDCEEMLALSRDIGTTFKTIVFPRNQVEDSCLQVASKYGLTAYRGNQENRFWKNSQFEEESVFKKAGRVLDAYFRISRTKAYQVDKLERKKGVLNVPANRFLRPYAGRKWLERRKIRRIKNEMYKAAKKGLIYHLWWHPHNFAKDMETNLNQLEELLAYYQVLNQKFEFTSLNLSEIATHGEK